MIVQARNHLNIEGLMVVYYSFVYRYFNNCSHILNTIYKTLTNICVGKKKTHTGSDIGLSPIRRQTIIWTIADLLLIRLLRTSFNKICIKIRIFSFKKLRLKCHCIKNSILWDFAISIYIWWKLSCIDIVKNIPSFLHQKWRYLWSCRPGCSTFPVLPSPCVW